MDRSRTSAAGSVGGYGDIHDNLRYWIGRLVEEISATGRSTVMYDVGANDGELTLPWAARGIPVVAFEPGSGARERLRQRAGAAPGATDNLTIIPVALGARHHTAVLTVYNDDTFSSLYTRPSTEEEQYGLAATSRERIEIVPLDALRVRQNLPSPAIIKIDVEGAERDVLLGAEETLRRAMPALIVEYSCPNCANAGYDRREIREILESYGYRRIFGLFRNEDRRLHDGPTLEDCRIWNLLVLPDTLQISS